MLWYLIFFMLKIAAIKIMPRLHPFVEYHLDLGHNVHPYLPWSSVFFGKIFGIWFCISFEVLRDALFIVRAGSDIIKTDFMDIKRTTFPTKMKTGMLLEELK